MLGKIHRWLNFVGNKKIIFFGKIIVQSAKLILYNMKMSRISMLLSQLSILQMIVSISLFAQYSHFPLSHLEVDDIETEKLSSFIPELETLSDIIDSSIFESGTNPNFHTQLIESSPASKISNSHSDEPTIVDVGISHNGSLKQGSNFAYIQNLPETQTPISTDSTDLISDIIYFLKDLFDDGNYSEENFFGNPDHILDIQHLTNNRPSLLRNSHILNSHVPSISHHHFSSQTTTTLPLTTIEQDVLTTSVNRSKTSLLTVRNSSPPPSSFNVFNLENDFNSNFVNNSNPHHSKRNRRAFNPSLNTNQNWSNSYAFEWEIKVFDPTSGDNEAVFNFDSGGSRLSSLSSSDMNLTINGPSSGGVGNLSVFAYGHIGGGNWQDYNTNSGFHFMTGFGGPSGNVTSHFNIVTSGIDAYINAGGHNTFSWGVYAESNNYYLTYNFDENSLAYSSTPEPSTYVMTGGLLCFIGFNQKSRKSLKRIFNLLSKKLNLPTCIEKLTRSQSHS